MTEIFRLSVMLDTLLYVFGSYKRHSELKEEMKTL